jgi:hypothetical protein
MNTVYLIQTAQFVALDQPVYKIGKTMRYMKTRYEPGYKIIYSRVCGLELYKAIKNEFDAMFTRRLDIGHCYYEGNACFMVDIINQVVDSVKCDISDMLSTLYIEEKKLNTDDTVVYITTYNQWRCISKIKDVLITNKHNVSGYYRAKNDISNKRIRITCRKALTDLIKDTIVHMMSPEDKFVSIEEANKLRKIYKIDGKIVDETVYNMLLGNTGMKFTIENNHLYKFTIYKIDVESVLHDIVQKCTVW